MVNTSITSNAMLNSVIHKTLEKSVEAIGLPPLERSVFENEMRQFVRNGKGSLLGAMEETNPKSGDQLWKAIMKSRIVVAEVWNHDTQVLYCRTRLQGFSIDFRVSCKQRVWHLESFTLVDRPLRRWQTPWIIGSAFACALVLAALAGYFVHPASNALASAPGGNVVAGQSSEVGSDLNPQANQVATANSSVSTENGNNATASANSTGTSAEKAGANVKQDTVTRSAPKKIPVTLAPGMSLYDFAKVLVGKHLVSDAMSFDMSMKASGVDKDLKPGLFVFESGMTVNQLLGVLRNGPQK